MGANELAPASAGFGTTLAPVVRCRDCGHGSLEEVPSEAALADTYAHVEDESTVDEEAGQVATARRDLAHVAEHLRGAPGALLDIGCWTGSLLDAAVALGWSAEGIEPSDWAAGRARERGHRVTVGVLGDVPTERADHQVVTCCDVLEHLVDPGAALDDIAGLLEPGGLLFATVPDAGSAAARILGHRWWSVLPMHVQYFTRRSLSRLLEAHGFEVLAVRTHPKVFTRRYYAERLAEFLPAGGGAVAAVARRRWADAPFAPDLHDRIAVIARRPEPRGAPS